MVFESIAPCKELKEFISHFWVASWEKPSMATQSTYFATANSITEMVFAFKETQQGKAFLFSSIQGQTSGFGQYTASDFHTLIGVSIYSHSIPRLFPIRTAELNNQFASLERLMGNEGKWLNEMMAATVTMDQGIKTLSDFFKLKLASMPLDIKNMDKAAKSIRQCYGNINIEKLSGDFCYSQKQFNRLFKEFIGFNPKLFSRIVRFESILKHYNSFNSLTELAHAYGYFDQSHFIREFRSFSGYSPTEFFKVTGY